ncbi:hypothetical protein BKA61DRAFT_164290 [Leptodontidium sp. MPI-SDFR-AT-0119]|nr:hypothetical protein BKA61DRAFT_164290 [Leptodontidium sp. MPI-SDFR-AT-0119]
MSYEDLEEARVKRVVKEATRAAKGQGKRGRKPKSSPPEVGEDIADTARRGRKRKSGTLEADEGDADTARCSRKRKSAAQDSPEPSNKVARAPVRASSSADKWDTDCGR